MEIIETLWNERGMDTCIPCHPNNPCPFNKYSKEGRVRKITSCRMPKESYEDEASFLAHWYLFHTIKYPYCAWCQLVTMDAYGKKVQCEGSESKDSDCLKHFKCHGFDDTKAQSYMIIYKVAAIHRVNIKLQYPGFTQTKVRKTTTYTPKYWIWLNMEKEYPRGAHHKNSCPRPFTTKWQYCVNHNLKNLTELFDHLEHVSKLEDGEVVDDPAPKDKPV